MIGAETKEGIRARLRRIAGQVDAIERMVDEDRVCVDLMHQLGAVQAALGKVGKVVLHSHVETCVADALKSSSDRERQGRVDDLMTVFARYGQLKES